MNANTRPEIAGSPPAAKVDDAALVDFVYAEARALDEKRFDEWQDMFTDDGRYWIPLTRGQPDGRLHTSLMYEDRLLLKVRVERLRSPNAFSQAAPSWCQHVLQQPRVESRDHATGAYVVRTPFVYAESQDNHQEFYAGVAWHHLVVVGGHLKMRMKKVELLNCDATLPSIQLFP